MNIVYRRMNTDDDWRWILLRLNLLWVPDMAGIIAVDADENIRVGAFVGCFWTRNTVSGNFIIDNSLLLRHGFIEEIADWVFGDLCLRYIHGNILSNNLKAYKLNKHIGFKEYCTLKDGFSNGVDMITMILEDKDCRLYKKA